jgi:hypothetical protein
LRLVPGLAINLGKAHDLTAGLIERLFCPDGMRQVFLRDTKVPGLRVTLDQGDDHREIERQQHAAKAAEHTTQIERETYTLEKLLGAYCDYWKSRKSHAAARLAADIGLMTPITGTGVRTTS